MCPQSDQSLTPASPPPGCAPHIKSLYTHPLPGWQRAEQDPETAARLQAWELAFVRWMASLQWECTRRKYRLALSGFLDLTRRLPWYVDRWDVERWLAGMLSMNADLRRYRFAGVKSFYTFVHQQCSYLNGRYSPLLLENPFEDLAWPQPAMARVQALSEEQLLRLLRAYDRDTPFGSRDYALCLVMLATGLKSVAVRCLRWQDFRWDADNLTFQVQVQSSSASLTGTVTKLLAPHFWAALQDYLHKTGRWDALQSGVGTERYLFTPLQDLTGVLAARRPAGWDQFPLSNARISSDILRYAAVAGLDPHLRVINCLRYTGAMLLITQGASLPQVADFLKIKDLVHARRILRRLIEQQAEGWDWAHAAAIVATTRERLVARSRRLTRPSFYPVQSGRRFKGRRLWFRLLGPEHSLPYPSSPGSNETQLPASTPSAAVPTLSARPSKTRLRKMGSLPGTTRFIKHGLYAERPFTSLRQFLAACTPVDNFAEISTLRSVLQQVTGLTSQAADLDQCLQATQTVAKASSQLANLLQVEREHQAQEDLASEITAKLDATASSSTNIRPPSE